MGAVAIALPPKAQLQEMIQASRSFLPLTQGGRVSLVDGRDAGHGQALAAQQPLSTAHLNGTSPRHRSTLATPGMGQKGRPSSLAMVATNGIYQPPHYPYQVIHPADQSWTPPPPAR